MVAKKPAKSRRGLHPPIAPAIAPNSQDELTRASFEGPIGAAKKVSERLEKIIAPAVMAGFHVGVADSTSLASVRVVVRRDEPFSATETEWLRKIVSDSLNILSEITVETVPFVGELIYEDDRPDLTEGMKRRLIVIRQIILKNAVGQISPP